MVYLLSVYHNDQYQDAAIAADSIRKQLMEEISSRQSLSIIPWNKRQHYKQNNVKINVTNLRERTKFWVPTSEADFTNQTRNGVQQKQNTPVAMQFEFRANINNTIQRALADDWTPKVNSLDKSPVVLQETKEKSQVSSKNTENMKIFEEIMRLTNDSTVINDRQILSTSDKSKLIRDLYSSVSEAKHLW